MNTSTQQVCQPALQSNYDRVLFLAEQDPKFVRDAFDLIANFADNLKDFEDPEEYLETIFEGFITSQDYIEHNAKKKLVDQYRNLKVSLYFLDGFFSSYNLSGYNYFDRPWSNPQHPANTDHIANKTDYNELNPLP